MNECCDLPSCIFHQAVASLKMVLVKDDGGEGFLMSVEATGVQALLPGLETDGLGQVNTLV